MRKDSKKLFLCQESIVTRDLYELYKKKRKKVAKEIDQYKLFEKVVRSLLLLIGRSVISEEGGVYIKDIGYFCAVKDIKNNKKITIVMATSIFNRYRKRDCYYPYLFVDDCLKGWTMNRTFNPTIRSKVMANKNYTINFDVAYSYHEAKKNLKKLSKLNKKIKYFT